MLQDILNYIPDPKNGRPIADGKVYFLVADYDAPNQDRDIDESKIAPLTADGQVIPQPIYTSKGGTLIFGSQTNQANLYADTLTARVAIYDKCGKLVYSVAYNSIIGADIISEEQPTAELIRAGVRWYKPSEPNTYVYYCDEDGCQWVQELVAAPAVVDVFKEFASVQDMKLEINLAAGQKVISGKTVWKVTTNASNTLPLANGLYATPLNGAWLDDWNVDITGSVACDAEFQEANLLGRAIMLGQGTYRLNSKKVLTQGTTVKGVSEHSIIDARMTDVLFEFPVTTGRNPKVFRDFHVYSSGSEMSANGVAFKFPGVAVGASIIYTSGFKFENIELGGGGAFACGWDISDSFRLTIRDCGYTAVTNPIRIRGNVVQCTIDNLTGNNSDYVRSYDGQNIGVYMETKLYADGERAPENIKILNCGFVTHREGIRHSGLAIMLYNCDLDFIRDRGTVYAGGDGHSITGGYIAHSGLDVPFIGSIVQQAKEQEDVTITNVTYATYGVKASKQTAVQIGDGENAPFAEPSGVTVTGVKIVGAGLSWDFGIQADRCANVQIDDNFVKVGVIKASGKAINASFSKSLSCSRNNCYNQDIYISAPDPVSTITATDNLANVVTEFIAPAPENVEIARNRVGP